MPQAPAQGVMIFMEGMMLVEKIMNTKLITIAPDCTMNKALSCMLDEGLRMLPVVDEDRCLLGVVKTFSILMHVVPDYIVSGDLDSVPYAPDIGTLHKHYQQIADKPVQELMQTDPLVVHPHESLLSVAAALVTTEKDEHALVVDADSHLLGVVSPSDVLRCLRKLKSDEH